MARDFVSTPGSILARFYFLVCFFLFFSFPGLHTQFPSSLKVFFSVVLRVPHFSLKKEERKGKLLFDGYVKNGREMES